MDLSSPVGGRNQTWDLRITHISVRCRALIRWAKVTNKSMKIHQDPHDFCHMTHSCRHKDGSVLNNQFCVLNHDQFACHGLPRPMYTCQAWVYMSFVRILWLQSLSRLHVRNIAACILQFCCTIEVAFALMFEVLRSTEMYTWLVRRLVISQYCGMYTAILSPCFCYSCFVHIRNIVVNRDSDVHSMYTRHQKFVMYHLPLMYRRSARSWLSNTTAARQSPPTWVGGWGTAS